jgi:cation:H+ antiporter
MGIIIPFILIILSSYFLWKSCSNFDRYSKVIGSKLTHGVRGATLNAIGSSLPEFFTALFFLIILQDVTGFSSGLSTILGSAIFNILLIPAIVIFILIKNKHNLAINKKLIFRDAGILLVSQIFLLYSIQDGVISLFDSFVLFLIYVAYLLVLSKGGLFTKDEHKDDHKKTRNGAWFRIFVSIGKISLWCLVLVFSCEILFTGTYPEFLSFLNFSSSDSLGFEDMMYVALIFAAAASSVPDLFISAFDAKSGDVDDSLANPLASNLFDICIAFGVPLFLYTLFNGEIKFDEAENSLIFKDIHSLTVLMIVITILFLISVISSKRYSLFHAFLFIFMFIGFVYFAFNLDLIYNYIPWL